MSRLERLRTLVNQRINAAADDISRLLEGKIAEYEEEVRFFREENNNLQQRLLRVVSKPGLYDFITPYIIYDMALKSRIYLFLRSINCKNVTQQYYCATYQNVLINRLLTLTVS